MRTAWWRRTGANQWRWHSRRWYQRGDTLVEVTIAFAVLGLVLGATSAIVNRSLLNIMNATERTTARGEVNSQAELLRYVIEHSDDNTSLYNSIINDKVNSSGDYSSKNGYGCKTSRHPFALKYDAASDKIELQYIAEGLKTQAATYAPHAEGDQGIWIDGVKHNGTTNSPDYVDFYVRACWTPYAANEVGQGRLESIVRATLPRS